MEDGIMIKEEPTSEEEASEDQVMYEVTAIKLEVLIGDERAEEEATVGNISRVEDEVAEYRMIKQEDNSTADPLGDVPDSDVLQGSIGIQELSSGGQDVSGGQLGGQMFACDKCDYRSLQLSYLKSHMKTHIKEKPYACDSCDYRGSQVRFLKEHLRTHTGEKPYACDSCDYRASLKVQLRRHMRTHTGEKPYACSLCDYRAYTIGHLNTHLQTHSGERPYACDICDYTATQSAYMKRHMKTHSLEKPYACDKCDYRATQSSYLKKHMKTHKSGFATRRSFSKAVPGSLGLTISTEERLAVRRGSPDEVRTYSRFHRQ